MMQSMTGLIPPQHVDVLGGSVSIGTEFRVWLDAPFQKLAFSRLNRELAHHGVRVTLIDDASAADCVVIASSDRIGNEAYRLLIQSSGIELSSPTDAGAFYGLHTLCDLIRMCGVCLPCLRIDDEPKLRRRGLYYDCSRGKVPTMDTVRQWVERLAEWKINELQFYVENVFTFRSHPDIGKAFSPFTPDEIRAIGAMCKRNHIRFVPSLASLGHMEKILMLPAYQELGELPGYRDWPGGTILCPGDPRSIRLLKDLYNDFLPLFEAVDFNVCGDEPWELGQGRSREKAEVVGVGRVYLDHILTLHKLCAQHGKRMNLWGDIVLKHPAIISELPQDVVMLNWEYDPDGPRLLRTHEFAEAGLEFLCCPGTHGWQSHGTRLQSSFRNIHQFADVAVKNGASGFLITDWGDWGHRNSFSVSLPSIAYGAACAWNSTDVAGPETDVFLRQFCSFYYGESGKDLVDGIRKVGDEAYGYWAYNALFERLGEPELLGGIVARGLAGGPYMMNRTILDTSILQRLTTECRECEGILGRSYDAVDPLAAHALDDYKLANQMNRASLNRWGLARQVRAGHSLVAAECSAHRAELEKIRDGLAASWRRDHRPSRLQDNLQGFDEAIAECMP